MIYKEVCVPTCPNGCFEQLIDEAEEQNTVAGVKPKLRQHAFGSSSIEALRYSERLKRHGKRANGHYISKQWTHCPFCGAKLEGLTKDGDNA